MGALLNPLDSWGPALLEHREHAARIHEEHGTKFGGDVYYFQSQKGKYEMAESDNGGPLKGETPAELA